MVEAGRWAAITALNRPSHAHMAALHGSYKWEVLAKEDRKKKRKKKKEEKKNGSWKQKFSPLLIVGT